MNESLPLFQFDEPRPDARPRGPDPHFDAARTLARRMGRLPDHSPAQVLAGQQICRHLVAMLKAHEASTPAGDPEGSH